MSVTIKSVDMRFFDRETEFEKLREIEEFTPPSSKTFLNSLASPVSATVFVMILFHLLFSSFNHFIIYPFPH